jgi:ABC-type branched-subunit amino acid transport system substrate-binding protein
VEPRGTVRPVFGGRGVRRWGLVASGVVASLVVAACGGSSSGGSPAPAGSSGVSPSSGGSSVAAGPVTIAGFFDLSNTGGAFQPWANSAKAAVKAIDVAGGINGHQLVLKICDTQLSANAALACGQQAVAEKAVAVFGFRNEAPEEPLLAKNHISDFPSMNDPDQFSAPNVFTINGSGTYATSGPVEIAKRLGCKTIGELNTLAVTGSAQKVWSQGLQFPAKALGVTSVGADFPPPGTPDMSPYAAAILAKHADCVYVASVGGDAVAEIKALYGAGQPVKVITSSSFISGSEKTLGPLLSKLTFVDGSLPLATNNPVIKAWDQQITKYSPSPKGYDGNSQDIWSWVQAIAFAIKNAPSPTAASVESYLNGLTSYKSGNYPPVNLSVPSTLPQGTRLFSPVAVETHYVNGTLTAEGGYYNVFTGKTEPLS